MDSSRQIADNRGMLPFAKPDDFGIHDLTAAFAGMAINDPRYGAIIQPLRQLEAVASIHKDLDEASVAIDLAARTARPSEEANEAQDEQLIVEALLVHALMLYCRAAHSNAKGRKQMDFKSKYSSEEQSSHELVASLRDNVVAHHGPAAKHPGEPWLDDRVVLYRQLGLLEFSYPSVRPATKASVTEALIIVVSAAKREVDAYGREKEARLSIALQEGLTNDPELRARVGAHPFDEIAFFGRPNPPGGASPRISVPAGAPLSWEVKRTGNGGEADND